MAGKAPVSILIPVRNEEANLDDCLRSCGFADEVVIVDSGSTDHTPTIAQKHSATLVDFVWNGNYPKKKNWALANVPWRNDWVFILDADERITPELALEIDRSVRSSDFQGFYVNRRFWFIDGWLRHCGYYPSWNLRLFRHTLGRYEQMAGAADTRSGDNEVHEHVILEGRIGRLRHDMDHFAFPTIDSWVEKHNRYSNWEARLQLQAGNDVTQNRNLEPTLARKRALKALALRAPFRPLLRFLYHYVWRAGFLDGYRGYVFCRLMGFYEFLSVSKRSELNRRRREN